MRSVLIGVDSLVIAPPIAEHSLYWAMTVYTKSCTPFLLGACVLQNAKGEGQEPSGSGQSIGLQVDPDYLSVLADKDSLQRGEVPGEVEGERITAAELRSKQSAVEITKSLDSNASVGC